MIQQTSQDGSFKDSIDSAWYHRVKAGETEVQIAQKEGISIDEVQRSIKNGEQLEFARFLREFLGFRLEVVIHNERFRKRIRKRFEDKVIDALGRLLSGERTLIEKDRKTGEVRFHKFIDLELIARGIEQYRKTTSLEEKPAPVALSIVNVQQSTHSALDQGQSPRPRRKSSVQMAYERQTQRP